MEDMKKHLGQVDVAKVKLMVRVEEDYENGKLSFDAARAMLEERVGSCTPAEIALADESLPLHHAAESDGSSDMHACRGVCFSSHRFSRVLY